MTSVLNVDQSLLTESSGLAASRRVQGYYWSHNDSGDTPRLFAFDSDGNATAVVTVEGADAIDWEDMAGFLWQGHPFILVADCGDNQCNRESISLYLFPEPDPTANSIVKVSHEIRVCYSQGKCDCEAVLVDSRRNKVILITKSALPLVDIYVIDLPLINESEREVKHVTAKRVGMLGLPMVTAADLDPRNGDVWLSTYLGVFRFVNDDFKMSLGAQFSQLPKHYESPRLKQIEALALDLSGNVWVTSEGSPTPFVRVRKQESEDSIQATLGDFNGR